MGRGKMRFLFAILVLAGLGWTAPSWATCTGGGGSPQILTGTNGLSTGSWTIDGTTDQTANFNNFLTNCAGEGPAQLDCRSNNPYYINGAVSGGRFNLKGCGRGNGGLKFGASGGWEMVGGTFDGYSTVQDMFIQGTATSAFTEDSGSNYNVFSNIYCTGVGRCIVDHGNYNVVDNIWANNFTDSAIYADGVGPLWHGIALQSGSSSHPCIYFSGASLIMNTFSINECGGDMVIEGVTSGNACQGASGNWNHISDGFFDAVSNYPGSTPSMEIKNNSSGNCQMGSTHFSNVGFESSLVGLKIDTDDSWDSTINSVTCSDCQFHNNKNQGILVTGKGVIQVRLSNVNVVSNGASPLAPTTALTPNAEFDCPGCLIVITGSSFGGDGVIPGTDPWGNTSSSEGPNETAKNTHNLEINPPTNGAYVMISNTLFDSYRTTGTNFDVSAGSTICFDPYYNGTGHGTENCRSN